MTTTQLTIDEIISALQGYHDYPECCGNCSLELRGIGPWYLSTASGSDYWWDGAPTYKEVVDAGLGEMLEPDWMDDCDPDDTVDEGHIVNSIISRAHAVCDSEETAYEQEWIDRRIDHIIEQINWDTQRVRKTHPRDFANEFDLDVVDDLRPGDLDESDTRATLARWIAAGDHYGTLLDELDTYAPY